ncbi:MAG: TetR/AcrR family transcriptional regulator [Acidobacteriota bacterium]
MSDTKTRLLDAATRHFADHGFYGASMAGIAKDIGLTKQALIHHFQTKEKLYGEVLRHISDRLLSQILRTHSEVPGPRARLESLLLSLQQSGADNVHDTRLVLRELLDNKRRAERASSWYLKPFLDALIALVKQVPGWESASDSDALAAVYQIIGAIHFFAISEPTLTQMFGKQEYRRLGEAYPARLRTLIAACLDSPPPSP